jgi:LPS sulfotransferase NodH
MTRIDSDGQARPAGQPRGGKGRARPGSRRGPDFVCIGAQKAGTTWLFDNLEIQDGIWVPPEKEIHFFNAVCPHEELLGVEELPFPHGLARYRPLVRRPARATLRWLRRFHNEPRSTAWYHSLFANEFSQGKLRGDLTPAYSTLDERGVAFARRVLHPGVRVFLVIRNPIERTWSAIRMMHRWQGQEISKSNPDAILADFRRPSQRLRTDYARMIRAWTHQFGDRFRVFLYDDLTADPASFLQEVAQFIDLPGDLRHDRLGARSNAAPNRLPIPPELEAGLEEEFRDSIEELDTLVTGVAARWAR